MDNTQQIPPELIKQFWDEAEKKFPYATGMVSKEFMAGYNSQIYEQREAYVNERQKSYLSSHSPGEQDKKEVVKALLIEFFTFSGKYNSRYHAANNFLATEKSQSLLSQLFQPEEKPPTLEDFAKWMDNERNSHGLWRDLSIWGKENAVEIMLERFLEIINIPKAVKNT